MLELQEIVFAIFPDAASFWEVQRSFIERTLDMEAVRESLVGVGAVVGLIGLIMLILHFRPKKPYIPQDWILDPTQIAHTLTLAMTQRSKFELQFAMEGETRRPALRCSGVEVENDAVVLEASGMVTLSERWVGKAADCFFIIRLRDTYAFYAFTSIVTQVRVVNDISMIQLQLPERLETRQKRLYLRIPPPEEYMLGAALWRGPDLPAEGIRNDLALWPKPSRILLPGVREEFFIRDISSGGLKLHLPRHIVAEEMELIHVSTQFMIMLDLWDPDKAQRLRFWMLCRMQSPVLDFETKGMDLGAQFLAWAKPAEAGSSSLLWLKLAASGEVEPIGNWIMRRHLEFFRESEHAGMELEIKNASKVTA